MAIAYFILVSYLCEILNADEPRLPGCMEIKSSLPNRPALPLKILSKIAQQERCVAHLAIGQGDMQLEADSIWQITNGAIDILIVGICEDGLTDVTAMLKQRNPNFQTIAVELVSHLSLADTHPDFEKPLPLELREHAASEIPHWSSEVMLVRQDEAVVPGRLLAQLEELRDDIVTCTLLCAAVRVGQRLDNAGKQIVMFPSPPDRFVLPLKHPWR